ncbi:serine-tRNA ligase-like protein [Leptotrombidium deliense]|uniref:Serine-tRNA ligase-like protein n=1 Tax=Leptotrombidium deliense TaxID=299467 RepID=A0A443SDJ1_9ACAR|nr:serine-tRNA ligase-like protein [Leptotrombidium deliense]
MMFKEMNKNVRLRRENVFSMMYLSGRYADTMKAITLPNIDLILDDLTNDEYVQFVKLKELRSNVIELKKELKCMRLTIHTKKENEENVPQAEKDAVLAFAGEVQRNAELLWDMEDKMMPFVLRLPNAMSPNVSSHDSLIVRSVPPKDNYQFNALDYRKLAYTNQTMYRLIVGRNCDYFHGKGAKIYFAIKKHFAKLLRDKGFIDFSGLDFVKSAIIEASNDVSVRNYNDDSLTIHEGFKLRKGTQRVHLTGDASFESMAAFIVKLKQMQLPTRLFSIGCQYDQSLQQLNTLHCVSVTESEHSMREMQSILDTVWNAYVDLDVPCRLINCNQKSLNANEYLKYTVEVWFPSSRVWRTVARISHYNNFVSRRLGLQDVHFIDATVADCRTLLASIMENNQLFDGSFAQPKCIQQI